MRTQVGYAGGTKKNPTYYNLGDHSETIEIEFDPRKVSYEKLLDIFWESHESTAQPFSRQYASFIFFHTDEQKRKAQESKKQVEAKKGKKLFTEIVQAQTFYPAEDYHQEYWQGEGQRNPYCLAVIPPKLQKLRKSFAARVKV